ncbi:MAG: nicotinamide-nucleotide amidase [Plesiomonas sp.]|uniref:nicotinamide-nucleotide amidase n=1 Tax=Plesiomonas sp. TaxID=2486279 RepID=UPI003F3B577E
MSSSDTWQPNTTVLHAQYSATNISHAVGARLRELGWHIATAESCTGGGIISALTDIAGSSDYVDRGFITYTNQSKHQMLGVSWLTLDTYGAVSEPTVCEMVHGALQMSEADVAIAVSGIAGPAGGTPEKPVGTIWFAFASRSGRTLACQQCFLGDRALIRMQAVHFALQTLQNEFLF